MEFLIALFPATFAAVWKGLGKAFALVEFIIVLLFLVELVVGWGGVSVMVTVLHGWFYVGTVLRAVVRCRSVVCGTNFVSAKL